MRFVAITRTGAAMCVHVSSPNFDGGCRRADGLQRLDEFSSSLIATPLPGSNGESCEVLQHVQVVPIRHSWRRDDASSSLAASIASAMPNLHKMKRALAAPAAAEVTGAPGSATAAEVPPRAGSPSCGEPRPSRSLLGRTRSSSDRAAPRPLLGRARSSSADGSSASASTGKLAHVEGRTRCQPWTPPSMDGAPWRPSWNGAASQAAERTLRCRMQRLLREHGHGEMVSGQTTRPAAHVDAQLTICHAERTLSLLRWLFAAWVGALAQGWPT